MPYYGDNQRPDDVVPDWILGGNRKRRVIAALASEGWRIPDLIEHLGCGRSTVYEIVRALRTLGVLVESAGSVRLDLEHKLGRALAALLAELEPFGEQRVDRPPRYR